MFRRADVAERGGSRVHERWARLRFSVIGQLEQYQPDSNRGATSG